MRRLFGVCFILAVASLPSYAVSQFNISADNLDPTLFEGSGGWTSGNITLPGGTTFGSNPLELDLTLSHDLTLDTTALGYENYGFAMSGFNPAIQPGGDAFTFSIELLENGTLLTPTFATDIANPNTFGVDVTNPLPFAIDNLSIADSTTALNSSITFDQVDILVSNSNPGGESANSFSVQIGDVPEPSVIAIGLFGFLGMIGLRYRKGITQ